MSIPSSLTPLFNSGSSAAAAPVQIERSLRFNSADSAYLSRTPAVAGNRRTWTWAGWVKRSALGAEQVIFSCMANDVSFYTSLTFEVNDKIYIYESLTANGKALVTTQLFRDPSAWFHILLHYNTTDATNSNKAKLYINGTEVTQFDEDNRSYLTSDASVNRTAEHDIGKRNYSPAPQYLSGSLADIHFIDGQALTPSSFTEVSATTGQLIPLAYAGTFGTNGFWLKFSDNSAATAAALGNDYSGNNNDWTPNNFQVSATGPIYSSTFTYSGTGSPAGVQDAPGAFLINSPTITDNSQSAGRSAVVNHSGGTSFIQFNPSPAISGSNVRVFTYQPQGTSGADTWINVNGGSDLRPWRVSPNYTGWSNSVAIPGGSLSSLRVSLSYAGGSGVPFWAVEVDGVVLRESLAQNIDSFVDTPTSYGTPDTGVGNEVRGNYATWNPLSKQNGAALANGNLDATYGTSSYPHLGTDATIVLPSSGKWYWEVTVTAFGEFWTGVRNLVTEAQSTYYRDGSSSFNNIRIERTTGSGGTANGASYTNNDVIGVAVNCDALTISWYKNGTIVNSAYSLTTVQNLVPYAGHASVGGSSAATVNFGQRAFAYTAPSGFKALCDTNLPAPLTAKPNTVMDVKLYTGNGSTQSITGLAFSPDFVWIKSRSGADNHAIQDAVRGVTLVMQSNTTNAEVNASNTVGSFTSDGFSLAGGAGSTNGSSVTYVAWAWDAGTTTASNGSGSITSQVRANVSAGFSVVGWTSNGTSGIETTGHGLGVSPDLIIVKNRDASSPWQVFHSSFSNTASDYLFLNTTDAKVTSGATIWTRSSTTFGFRQTSLFTNGQKGIAYCFAAVSGYSSFGSYTGNGSTDGPFIFTSFRPRWLLIKRYDSAGNWVLIDTARSKYNPAATEQIFPHLSDAEYSNSAESLDILSNGFKPRSATSGHHNYSGYQYLYIAFAENPFQYARAR